MDSPPASDAAHVMHPYYPPNAPLDHFAANETPMEVLLLLFGGILAVVLSAAIFAAKTGARKAHVELTKADKLNVAWFALCKSSCHCREVDGVTNTASSKAAFCTAFSRV